MKRQFEGNWYYDPAMRGFEYIPAGEYEEGANPEPSKFISALEIHQLIPVLEESGYLKPRLDERLRIEDLKITHRLLDLLGDKL